MMHKTIGSQWHQQNLMRITCTLFHTNTPASAVRAWLASSAGWVQLPLLPACRVRFLHVMRLNSWAGTRGFACVLFLNCDRPSHPDWGDLGMVRAAGMDNRWQVPAALLVGQGRTTGTMSEKPAG